MARSVILSLFVVIFAASATDENLYNSKGNWSDLTVRFSILGFVAHLMNRAFMRLPQNVSEARKSEWNEVSSSTYNNKWCKDHDVVICLLYDLQDKLAGVCVALPSEVIEDRTCYKGPLEYFQTTEIMNEEYYHSCFLLDSQETLDAGGRVYNKYEEIMGGATLHLPKLGSHGLTYEEVPRDVHNLPAEWTRQKCVSKMGRHYYVNMTEEHSCEHLYPWFLLSLKGRVIGVGFQIPGFAKKVSSTYVETVPKGGVRFAIYSPPQCYENSVSACGTISIHMYFVKKQNIFPNPWDISCKIHDEVD